MKANYTQIAVTMPAEFRRRIEAAARNHPGRPTPSAWVRWIIDMYLSGLLKETPKQVKQ